VVPHFILGSHGFAFGSTVILPCMYCTSILQQLNTVSGFVHVRPYGIFILFVSSFSFIVYIFYSFYSVLMYLFIHNSCNPKIITFLFMRLIIL
jgi:hypothetical protein